jgi:autotransporter-associated beta strand protein
VASAATLSGIVSGAFDLVKEGAAELTLSGANTFSGTTGVNGGTLTLSGGNALANSMAVTVNAGGLLKLASTEEIATLSGAGAANLQGNVLTVGGGANTTFSGVLSGVGGALVKNGSGVFTLSGANTFDGGVTLNAGAIQAGFRDGPYAGQPALAEWHPGPGRRDQRWRADLEWEREPDGRHDIDGGKRRDAERDCVWCV